MNPIRAQRTWHSLSMKWITGTSFGSSPFQRRPSRKAVSKRRKIKKGILSNLIPVEVVNAITGEVSKGYMRDLSLRRLKTWLQFHNHKAFVEQLFLSPKITLANLKEEDAKDFPILLKLGKYQVPYLIDRIRFSLIIKGRQTYALDLKTADNLKYLEIIAEKKPSVMKLFKRLKAKRKSNRNLK